MNIKKTSHVEHRNISAVSSRFLRIVLIAALIFISNFFFFGVKPLELAMKERPYWNLKSKHCEGIMKELYGKEGGKHFWSHDGQDYYTFRNHFVKLKRKGFYLDVAAWQPRYASTTYFYDHCLGWKGLCIEANPTHHHEFRGMRTCELIPRCVSSNDNQVVQFHDDESGSGIIDSTYTNDARQGNVTTMKCTTLRKILEERSIKKIDYFSLDVEGHELEVLNGINWVNTQINLVTMEVASKDGGILQGKLIAFMKEKGFKMHDIRKEENTEAYPHLFPQDRLFLHKSVSLGSPK